MQGYGLSSKENAERNSICQGVADSSVMLQAQWQAWLASRNAALEESARIARMPDEGFAREFPDLWQRFENSWYPTWEMIGDAILRLKELCAPDSEQWS